MSIINNYTEQEMLISNKSYTNKDFNTIYPELLDLVKKLTNKWDPTTSNESDPGVVLLKLWSILADKLNYNIDKNILEAFPLSVTLRGNAEHLYNMLGYNLRYYQSATTQVYFYYMGDAFGNGNSGSEKVSRITIPKWTMLTNDNGDILYTLIEDVVLSARGEAAVGDVIQGSIHTYEVNGVTEITLDNLDAENRIFFTETQIAENGIFIENIGSGTGSSVSEWTKVNNLESQDLNKRVYKFGVMPNSNTCYIQFPQDISSLISNGLSIKYIITDGSAGNISKSTLTTIVGELIPKEFKEHKGANGEESDLNSQTINSDLIVRNTASTHNGLDPEDLDSAYKNYKKTIGTFNTLVTKRDYENAIYNLIDELGTPEVSNVVVSDRTDDINNSSTVLTISGNTVERNLKVDTQSVLKTGKTSAGTSVTIEVEEPRMSAFDIGLYLLEPMLDIYDDPYYYNKSFSKHTLADDVVTKVESTHNICHNYLKLDENELSRTLSFSEIDSANNDVQDSPDGIIGVMPYIYKNFYTLTGKVVTYYKVADAEADEIEKNIKSALYKAFNARNVEFGSEIKFDDIIKVIESADTRIKTAILHEPELTFKYMKPNDFIGNSDTAVTLPSVRSDDSNNERKFTLALLYSLLVKMVSSGHVQLFNFNKDILFEFGLTELTLHKNVTTVTTESKLEADTTGFTIDAEGLVTSASVNDKKVVGSDADGYKVQANENIILYAPNFYTKTAYTSYVNYRFDSKDALGSDVIFKANTYYKLDKPIYLRYTDSNGSSQTPSISKGTYIRFTSNDVTKEFKMNPNLIVTIENKDYMSLGADEKLEILDVNEVVFNTGFLRCLWFTNRTTEIDSNDSTKKIVEYTLFKANESLYILQDNEYFMYADLATNELVILGSGTMLCRPKDKSSAALTHTTSLKTSEVIEYGVTAVDNTDWKRYDCASVPLSIVELQIVTLGEGAGVRFASIAGVNSTNKTLISSTPRAITGGQYCESLTDTVPSWLNLDVFDFEDTATRSYRLGWSVFSRVNLLTGPSTAQSITPGTTIKYGEGEGNEISGDSSMKLLSSAILATAGGENLQLSTSDGKALNLYSYKESAWPTYGSPATNSATSFSRGSDDFVTIKYSDLKYNIEEVSWNDRSATPVSVDFPFSSTLENVEYILPITFTTGGYTNVTVQVGKKTSTEFTAIATAPLTQGNTLVAGNRIIAGGTYYLRWFTEVTDTGGVENSFNTIRIIFIDTLYSSSTETSMITDTIRLGKISVINSDLKYSPLLTTTVKKVCGNTDTALVLALIENVIEGKLPTDFDKTYRVSAIDHIDTDVNGSEQKDYLFAGAAIWDKNHICNKFTIPQIDTKRSSITVAAMSLREERKN